ncbi:flap structure-specific endonuclease [Moniliophthora roreri]|nr:flap structure-specific endonuclease [Moniliophthora roreri]
MVNVLYDHHYVAAFAIRETNTYRNLGASTQDTSMDSVGQRRRLFFDGFGNGKAAFLQAGLGQMSSGFFTNEKGGITHSPTYTLTLRARFILARTVLYTHFLHRLSKSAS